MRNKTKILSILLASVLALGFLATGCIPSSPSSGGNTLQSLANEIAADRTKLNAVIAQANATDGQVNTLKQEVSALSVPDLSGYVTDAELNAAIDSFLANLTPAQVTALKTKLGLPTSTSTANAVTATIATKLYEYTNVTTATTSINPQFSLKLTNNLAEEVNDIKLVVYFSFYSTISINWGTPVDPTLGGGFTTWTIYSPTFPQLGVPAVQIVFANYSGYTGWGFSLDAGEVKTISLNLVFPIVVPAGSGQVQWEAEVDIVDFGTE